MMKSKKKQNYFYCLAKNEGCKKDLFGEVACGDCEKDKQCNHCGRIGTSFCDKCENNKNEGEDNDIT